MSLPFFYEGNLADNSLFILSEETSRHIIQVLRMQKGQQLQITNGKGQVQIVEIVYENKKAAGVKVISSLSVPEPISTITIAISPTKNKSRFEWFLEKVTEIGVQLIVPMICERSEKEHIRFERMNNILISAMLQSKQSWLPELSKPVKFNELIQGSSQTFKYIAHCVELEKQSLLNAARPDGDRIVLIGPEGDFTKEEIAIAMENNFIPVSLGKTRLRTETAGIVSIVLLNQFA